MLKDISNETSLARAVEFIKASTRIAPKTSSEDIDTLNYKELSGSLIINREYQRNYIQTPETASAYIESIFLGLIIPEIQVFEDYNTGTREIIDGQQRVLSLLKFYRGEYRLTKLKEFPQLNDLTYNELPQELKNVIRTFQVNIRTFTNEDQLYKYTIFERLNTGTKKLNSQEVRNCVYRGKMIDLAKELAENEDVAELFIGVKNTRYQRVEVILNIMASMFFFKSIEKQKLLHSDVMKVRINKFLELSREFSDEQIQEFGDRFLELTKFILTHFNLVHIVHIMYPDNPNYSIVKTLCESLYCGLSSYDLNQCEPYLDKIRTNVYTAFTSEDYKETIGTSALKYIKSIIARHTIIDNAISEGMKYNSTLKMARMAN